MTCETLGGRQHLTQPETKSSWRRVTLDPHCVASLRAQQPRLKARCPAYGAEWEDHDLVFPARNGQPFHPRTLSEQFSRLIAEAGVPVIHLHALRHTSEIFALTATA